MNFKTVLICAVVGVIMQNAHGMEAEAGDANTNKNTAVSQSENARIISLLEALTKQVEKLKIQQQRDHSTIVRLCGQIRRI